MVTGMTKVYMETYGCSANQSHSEVMLGLLKKAGFEIVTHPKDADLIVINTCIVKEPTEKRMIYRLKTLQNSFPEKKMIVAGCMPTGEYELVKKFAPSASLIGPSASTKIVECVEETLKGKRVEYLTPSHTLCHTKLRFNPYINIVEIAEGCLGNCSYCIVKRAKGSLISHPISDIKEDIEMSLREGCREIWLTSQDCGCYGLDRGKNLINLLEEVTKIPGDFRIRLGMANPNHIKPILSDLIEIFRDRKMYKFIHIPVQSGSDKVLRDMNRKYVTEDFRKIVRKFRKEIPEVTVWTDIIVGYPTETDKDFKETLKLIKETKPDYVNISKFGSRPGTPAEKLEKLEGEEVKERSRKLSELVGEICLERNKRWVGKASQVLVTEKRGKQYMGRNESYKQVIIETKSDILGKFVTAKIKDCKKTHLKGEYSSES